MFILELFRYLSLSLSPNTSRVGFKKLKEDKSGPEEFIESLRILLSYCTSVPPNISLLFLMPGVGIAEPPLDSLKLT